ncbi:hypothetical protein SK128_027964, partial [Halocaridina rubra]
ALFLFGKPVNVGNEPSLYTCESSIHGILRITPVTWHQSLRITSVNLGNRPSWHFCESWHWTFCSTPVNLGIGPF